MRIFSRKLLAQLLLHAGILTSTLAPAIMHPSCPCSVYTMEESYDSDGTQVSDNSFSWSPQSFDWSAQPTYSIQGTVCTSVPGRPNPVCDLVTFVIDPPNSRLFFDLGGHGKYYILENETFIILPVFPTCLRVLKADGSNFTFADQVQGYLTAISMPDSKQNALHYFGLVSDVGSCRDKMALELHLRGKYLSEFNFSQRIALPVFPGCLLTTSSIIFDQSTINKGPTDPFFNLPTDCTNSAPDYCQEVYFPGNPCDL